MPKLKTKSGVKKRFRLTGTGKVISTQANKRHVQSGDREHMRKPSIAQRTFVVFRDAAAVAGDQRGGNRPGTAWQNRMDARRNAPAQQLDSRGDALGQC